MEGESLEEEEGQRTLLRYRIKDFDFSSASFEQFGDILYALGAYYEATFSYEAALKKDGRNHKIWGKLGSARFHKGENGWAFSEFTKALRFAESAQDKEMYANHQREALEKLAAIHLDRKEGIASLVESVYDQDEKGELLTQLGDIVCASDRPEQAVICYGAALKKDSGNPEILKKQDKAIEALADQLLTGDREGRRSLRDSIEDWALPSELCEKLGDRLYQSERFDETKLLYKEALKENPENLRIQIKLLMTRILEIIKGDFLNNSNSNAENTGEKDFFEQEEGANPEPGIREATGEGLLLFKEGHPGSEQIEGLCLLEQQLRIS